jgi:hypothetical protein
MPGTGIAVVGATGGCGTTTMAAAITAWGGAGICRVLGLDGHGGGPHTLWGVRVERGVDHLDAVRAEVDAGHVQHIAHKGMAEWDLVAGPESAMTYAGWGGDLAPRLVAAMVPQGPWVADLGRGDHQLAECVVKHASGVVVMTPCSLDGAEACRHLLPHISAPRVLVAAVARPGEHHVSRRAIRRLVPGHTVMEVPWDRRGVGRLASGATGRRGLQSCVGQIMQALVTDG